MKMTTKQLAAATALALCFWSASQANAQVDYSYTLNNSETDLTGGFNVTLDGSADNNILVGGAMFTASGTPVPGYSSFTTVCLDLRGTLFLGSTYAFTEQGFSSQTGLNPAWGNGSGAASSGAASAAINNAAALYAAHENVSSATDWAALQLAVWKALYDTEANGSVITTGSAQRFTVQTDPTGAAWTEAQTWLGQLPANPNYTGYLLYPANSSAQEVLIGVAAVPEPATLAAGAILLVPFGMSSLRLLRRRSIA
jgi:hypothetical protein